MSEKKTKIAFLVNYFGPAGLENFVLTLINKLDPEKFEPYLYIIYWSRDYFIKKVRPGIHIHHFNRRSMHDFKFLYHLVQQAKKDGIEFVQVHNWGTFLEGWTLKFFLRYLKLIHVQQGSEFESTLKATFYKKTVRKILRKLCVPFFDRIVAVSGKTKKYLQDEWGASEVNVIYNSVDCERFTGLQIAKDLKDQADKHFIVCTVGRMVEVKNYICLYKAIHILSTKIPNLKFYHLGDNLIDGRGSQGELSRYVTENKLEEYFEFLGIRDDVHLVLGGCDVFALTSFSEGLSLSLIEAQASGLPCVATDVGGNPEVIKTGENGFLVPSNNEVAVANAIYKLYKDPELRKKMSTCARQFVQETFDVKLMIRSYEKIYMDIVNENSSG